MRNVFSSAVVQANPALPMSSAAPITLRDVLLLLRRYRWLIVVGTCLGTTLALVVSLRAEPRFTARASLVIDPVEAPLAEISAAAPSLGIDIATITTQLNIIRSRQHMARVVADLGLADEPAFAPKEESGAGVAGTLAGLIDPVLEWLPAEWLVATGVAGALTPEPGSAKSKPAKPAAASTGAVAETLLDVFGQSFTASQDGESRVINLSFTSTDPKLAAKAVNRAAELYVEAQLNDKRVKAATIAKWIDDRLATVAEDVRRSEDAVEAYRVQQDLAGDNVSTPERQELAELNRELGLARGELASHQSKVQLVRRLQAAGDTNALLGIVDSPILLSLREQEQLLLRQEGELALVYGDRHPRVQLLRSDQRRIAERIGGEVGRLAVDLERQADLVATRLAQLEQQLVTLQARDYRRGKAEVGLRELERQVRANQQVYQLFLVQSKEIGEQTQIIEADARIISRGQPPEQQSSLGPRLFTLLGFTISATGSTLLALLLESLNRRVSSARQVERLFGRKVLGAVPRVGRHGQGHRQISYLQAKPMSSYAEALRSIHTAVHLSSVEIPPRVILISSALSGEGKTTFSIGLATTAAQWGQRVLLVDLDLRHPSVAQLTGLTAGDADLVEVMNGQAPWTAAVQPTDGGFDCLCVYRRPSNPTGLVGSVKMHRLLNELRANYDLVVIDSAPLLAVTDGRIIAPVSDKVVFVSQWRQTPLSAVRHSLQLLTDARADLAGIALLQVDANKYMYFDNEDGANYYRKIKKYYVE